ncbi:MAG: MarR family transcriptional regulator [Myxococcales bacterium]|nr:MarR family transcriptional regulator [Myxococcales bacterium]
MDPRVEAVRRFNRFYTQKIGVLEERLQGSRFSLTEVRVLWELAHGEARTATALGQTLAIDAGYLSRILSRFERERLVTRAPAAADRRRSLLGLTAAGRRAFAPLDAGARREVTALLEPLGAAERQRLVEAMRTVEALLGGAAPADAATTELVLRPPRPGDLGWVVQRHGALYAEEYRWNAEFEALVAGIVARFAHKHDATRERCWIAERDGQNAGCVFVVAKSKLVAQLRLLLVEPSARGHGLGARLIDECVRFARDAGYRELTLWTNSVLHAARRLYERGGFTLVAEEGHHSFGTTLMGQSWSRRL